MKKKNALKSGSKDEISEIDLAAIKTISIKDRGSKVHIRDMGRPVKGGKAFKNWLKGLPRQLAAERITRLTLEIRRSVAAKDREIVWMMGAHVIKCGLSRYLIELLRRGYITTIAVNGAWTIHDLELAFFGETSEDVARNLEKGVFGFSRETAEHFFEAVKRGSQDDLGLGASLGRYILKSNAPHKKYSVLAQAYRFGVPVTVHIAIGTDIINQHPGFDGALWGELSTRDFRIFSARIERLGRNGGVVLNVGSAVILPEVFLKAYSIARNLGARFDKLTTCNIDMIQHYRPSENVLKRPTRNSGSAISLTGHHEIMIPLLYSALLS